MLQVLQQGRSLGVFVIFASQSPSTEVIPQQLRMQLGTVILLGTANADIQRMAFGEVATTGTVPKFTGYYILVSLPVITVISLYATDYVQMLSSNDKFLDAFQLIPYFAFGTFFMAITDYTTLQYHLANKTYIDFIIKLTSGILNVGLNILLIPKYGLVGVGMATLGANFLYFLLSVIIVLPGLRLIFPFLTVKRMIIAALPSAVMYYVFSKYVHIPALFEMLLLIALFYLLYWVLADKLMKRSAN